MRCHLNWILLIAMINKGEERISDLEDKLMERNEVVENIDRPLVTHGKRLREINEKLNVRIIAISEGVEREGGLEGVFEQSIAENFPNLGKETSIHVREAERTPPKLNHDRPMPCHVIVQFANIRSKDISELRQTCLHRPGKRGKVGRIFLKLYPRKICRQGSFIQQGCHSELMER